MSNKPKQEQRPEKLLSLPDTAEILGCSIRTVRRRVKAGDLATIRDGGLVRVHPEDLQRYIQCRRFG